MEIFQNNEKLMKAPEMSVIIRKYNHLFQGLVKYEIMNYKCWIRSLHEVFDCLNTPVLLKTQDLAHFKVNFDQLLLVVIRESQLMLKLGLDVPKECKRLLIDAKYFKLQSERLQV